VLWQVARTCSLARHVLYVINYARAPLFCVYQLGLQMWPSSVQCASPWSSGKCVRVRLSARSYQDLVNWYCSHLTRHTVCGRTAGNTPRTQKQTEWNEAEIVQTLPWRYKPIAVMKPQRQTNISVQCGSHRDATFAINRADGALCKIMHLFGMNWHCMGTRY